MQKPQLVIMAAGLGSRYGGLKQMAPVDPQNHWIIDYSIFDAVRAGFGKIILIVKPENEQLFRDTLGKRIGGAAEIEYVHQRPDILPDGFSIPEGRVKPWGTAHAVLCAKRAITAPFAVINADDFYGKDSFKILGDWLRAHEGKTGVCSIVGFELDNTLSENGKVSRGICYYDEEKHLTGVAEHVNVGKEEDGKVYGDNTVTGETHLEVDGKALCSMNMWGFTPDYFSLSADIFEKFLEENLNELKKEYYIPYAVDNMIKSNGYKCEVLSTDSRWFGVTYKEDRPGVVAKFQELADKGVYPAPLWKK